MSFIRRTSSSTGTCNSWFNRKRTRSRCPSGRRLLSMVTTVVDRFVTKRFPLRSRIRPRGAGSGTMRTRFRVARCENSCVARTCRNHNRVERAANMNATSAASTVIRVLVLPSVMVLGGEREQGPGGPRVLPPEHPFRSGGLGDPAEQRVEQRGEERVVDRGEQRHAKEEEEPHVELPEQEGHEAVEEGSHRRRPAHQQDREDRAR